MLPLVLSLVVAGGGQSIAQDGQDKMREGAELLQEGLELLLQDMLEELGPAWQELREMIGDLSAYYAPEILPNGDIILRRKVPLDSLPEDESEIEL